MEKARAGEIDLIITKSISRFARNTVTVLSNGVQGVQTRLKRKDRFESK